ncbi:TrmH family RNA methyltransferase [Brachybacterium sp. DNPG3]
MHERPDQSPITSPRSERVRRIAALSGRSARRKQGRFRVEGPQSVRSLLEQRPGLVDELFLTERADADHPELAELAAAGGLRARTVDEAILRAMTREGGGAEAGESVSPQGAVAVGLLPEPDSASTIAAALDSLAPDRPASILVLHEVRDPGNVGTLIRTADASGADLVVLTRTSADPFSPKAVRASAGSLFHLPVLTGADAPGLLDALASHRIIAAATSGYADTDLFEADLPERIAWIMGNEARGLDEDTLAAAPLTVRIPLAGRAESLNVHTAATVCLFETLRRRRSPA